MQALSLLRKCGRRTLILIYILAIGFSFLIFEIIFTKNSSPLVLQAIPLVIGIAIAIYSIQNNIIQSLEAKISKVETENSALEYRLQSSDALEPYNSITGLPTFVFQRDRISMALKWAKRQGRHIAVYRIQVGSYISNESGLEELPENVVIRQRADRLKSISTDNISLLHTGRTDFLILVESISAAKDILLINKNLEATLTTPILMKDGSAAIGLDKMAMAVYPFDGEDSDSLLAVAENNLKTGRTMSKISRSKVETPNADHLEDHDAKDVTPDSGQPPSIG